VERDYLAALSDAVSLHDWWGVVARTVADAKAGDGRARELLTKHLIGQERVSLLDLAAKELRGVTSDDDVTESLVRQEQDAKRQAQLDDIIKQLK
jgi:hypothetical protein